jgi:hypothetical protein
VAFQAVSFFLHQEPKAETQTRTTSSTNKRKMGCPTPDQILSQRQKLILSVVNGWLPESESPLNISGLYRIMNYLEVVIHLFSRAEEKLLLLPAVRTQFFH